MIRGTNAIAKLKSLIGQKDPSKVCHGGQQAEKGTLRSFYGVDRFDNAYFVSETVAEAPIEEKALFDQGVSSDSKIDLKQTW